ncbi:CD226 antigen isoform X2 [Gouania willdenowi]|uniref:CD226 antigen isoform X2 n=1 Tax=Gouania willdenowi TaxID=441366 RepID=UPI001055793E|nr:CD226 antigen isoform X2 [Gouania willdenowi]
MGRLTTRLINAAFILSQRGKMEAVQKSSWYFVVLVFLPFLKVSFQEKETLMTVRLEEGMVLDCLCPWDGNFSMVSWTKVPNKSPLAVFHPEFGTDYSTLYKDRVQFLRMTHMDGSISIRNVTHQDIGLYLCSVQTFPQGPWTRSLQVEDLDEPPEEVDTTDTPAPELISVDLELEAEQSSNVTIVCNRQLNSSVYQVILEKMLHQQPWVIIGVCKKVEGGLVSEDYSDKGRVDCEDSLDVSLSLTHVGHEDQGFYRCSFSTDAGLQVTTVQLTVTAPGWFSLSLYMRYIYIGASVAGLLLVIIILILALRHRKNSRRVEYRVKLHPSQRQNWRQWPRQ